MCICINCQHINSCRTYDLIELQHNIQAYKKSLNFTPSHTLIQINLNTKNKLYILDWDLVECLSFIEQPGSWRQ